MKIGVQNESGCDIYVKIQIFSSLIIKPEQNQVTALRNIGALSLLLEDPAKDGTEEIVEKIPPNMRYNAEITNDFSEMELIVNLLLLDENFEFRIDKKNNDWLIKVKPKQGNN